ncbi:MAG: LamG domain-containing protein, partial [Candidatus Micrarchaeaceae archaeon]
MEIKFRAQLMTLLVLILFVLMLAELMIFVAINVGYNNIGQGAVLSSSSANYAAELKASSSAFASRSLSHALYALAMYEYTPQLRHANFITNLSMYISQLIINGTLPNVQQGSYAANVLLGYMGNETFAAYNRSIMNSIGTGVALKINQTRPVIFQSSPYSISVRYVENVFINSSAGLYAYSIPVNVSIPLNGTYDLLYAQEGILRSIKFSPVNNLTSIIGNAYATNGNQTLTSVNPSYIYGIVLNVPSGVTCTSLASNVPTAFRSAPLNKSIILATPNAAYITNATCTAANNYGGLVTYAINSLSSPPKVPFLIYSSSTNVLQQLKNYTKVLLYGPGMDLLNIESLRNAISNGYFFASPFTPSYIDRANASLLRQSRNGIFTFTNYNRMASGFSGSVGSSEIISQKGYSAPNALTITGWFYSSTFENNYQFPIDSNPEANWRIGFNSANTIFFDPGSHNDVSLSATVSYNKWYFVALTAQNSGTSTNWVFYLNGVNVGSGTVSSNIQSVNSIVLGDYAYPFVGQLANVQVYNKSLQPQQIQQLYQNGISAPPIANAGLVGWWPLNGNANDYSGFGNNGTATNVRYSLLQNYQRDSIFITPIPTTLQPIPGIMSCDTVAQCNNASLSKLYIGAMPLELQNKFEEAANFNGQSSYIYGQGVYAFPLTDVEWIYPTSYGSSNFQVLSEFDGSSPDVGSYQLALSTTGNVTIWNSATTITSTLVAPLNQWSLVGFSLTTNTLTVYLNSKVQTIPLSTSAASSSYTYWIFGWQSGFSNR